MASAGKGSRRSGACWIRTQNRHRQRVKEQPSTRKCNSLAPNAAAQWSRLRPSYTAKPRSPARPHGRTPHDHSNPTGLPTKRHRINHCGNLAQLCATSGLSPHHERPSNQALSGKETAIHRPSSRSRSLSLSDTAAVTHNPHSTKTARADSSHKTWTSELSPPTYKGLLSIV